jgi:hypothetical protein
MLKGSTDWQRSCWQLRGCRGVKGATEKGEAGKGRGSQLDCSSSDSIDNWLDDCPGGARRPLYREWHSHLPILSRASIYASSHVNNCSNKLYSKKKGRDPNGTLSKAYFP